jgi:hypothetical protein
MGLDPVFGKETSGKVQRVMRDCYLMQRYRYLIQSDRPTLLSSGQN